MSTRTTIHEKSAPKHFLSDKVGQFTESVIREMTRQAMMHGAINLAQGFPDFPAPAEIKQAAQQAVAADVNQYAITWGAKNLRNAIARQMKVWQGIEVDLLERAFNQSRRRRIDGAPRHLESRGVDLGAKARPNAKAPSGGPQDGARAHEWV